MNRKILLFLALLLLSASALARVDFGIHEFKPQDFKNSAALKENCSVQQASFWCNAADDDLKLITSKGIDVFFSPSGEVVAAFSRRQRGTNFNGNYNIKDGLNLIPETSAFPGAALLLDGAYHKPSNVKSTWQEGGTRKAPELTGTFNFTLNGMQVEKTVKISGVSNTVAVDVVATGGKEGATLEVAYPGVGNNASPIIKIGKGENVTQSPTAEPVTNPTYISMQSAKATGTAIVLRPSASGQNASLYAVTPKAGQIALGTKLTSGRTVLNQQVYAGPNEMVHYLQGGLLELPGLFTPNLMGRLSLGIIVVLKKIHSVVGSWGFSIILLTLLFRILVWPLIQTQLSSMTKMQALQPKLKALQDKYKGPENREKLTQETMKLYQEEGVNPMGGCLPALIQMPIFLILWRVFVNFEFAQGFMWIPDLGQNDPYYILPVLYLIVMVGQMMLSSKGNRQMMQQQLMISVVFVWFAFQFPAGVTLYLITSMAIQALQQYFIQLRAGDKPLAFLGAGAVAKSAQPAKGSKAGKKKKSKR